MKENNPWIEHEIPGEKPVLRNFGPLHIWCKVLHNELWITYEHIDDDSADVSSEPPESLTWSRWALKENYKKIKFTPVFPDRPVVVKPESSFMLTPKAQAKIYVRCPLWVRIELIKTENLIVEEIPTVVLSNTWFGTFTEGDICYWISSSARRQIPDDTSRKFLALCPIFITNGSNEELKVEKICLRVGGLSLFDYKEQLWSDLTSITFRGSNNVSQIKFLGKEPVEASSASLICSPRETAKKSLFAKTFISIKGLSGLGLFPE